MVEAIRLISLKSFSSEGILEFSTRFPSIHIHGNSDININDIPAHFFTTSTKLLLFLSCIIITITYIVNISIIIIICNSLLLLFLLSLLLLLLLLLLSSSLLLYLISLGIILYYYLLQFFYRPRVILLILVSYLYFLRDHYENKATACFVLLLPCIVFFLPICYLFFCDFW